MNKNTPDSLQQTSSLLSPLVRGVQKVCRVVRHQLKGSLSSDKGYKLGFEILEDRNMLAGDVLEVQPETIENLSQAIVEYIESGKTQPETIAEILDDGTISETTYQRDGDKVIETTQITKTLLEDNFDGNELDANLWNTQILRWGNGILVEDGSLELSRRSTIKSSMELTPSAEQPLEIRTTATLTFSEDRKEVFRFLTRSDGKTYGSYGEISNGIEFQINAHGQLKISEKVDTVTTSGVSVDINIQSGVSYDIVINDNGHDVSIAITESAGGETTTLSGVMDHAYGTNLFVMAGREGWGLPATQLDNVHILSETTQRREVLISQLEPEAIDAVFAEEAQEEGIAIPGIQTTIDRAEAELEQVTGSIHEAEDLLVTKQQEQAEAQNHVAQLEQELQEKQSSLLDTEQQIATAAEALATAQGELQSIQDTIATLESDIATLQQHRAEKEQRIGELTTSIGAIEEQIPTLQQEKADTEEEFATLKQEEMTNAQNTINSTDRDIRWNQWWESAYERVSSGINIIAEQYKSRLADRNEQVENLRHVLEEVQERTGSVLTSYVNAIASWEEMIKGQDNAIEEGWLSYWRWAWNNITQEIRNVRRTFVQARQDLSNGDIDVLLPFHNAFVERSGTAKIYGIYKAFYGYYAGQAEHYGNKVTNLEGKKGAAQGVYNLTNNFDGAEAMIEKARARVLELESEPELVTDHDHAVKLLNALEEAYERLSVPFNHIQNIDEQLSDLSTERSEQEVRRAALLTGVQALQESIVAKQEELEALQTQQQEKMQGIGHLSETLEEHQRNVSVLHVEIVVHEQQLTAARTAMDDADNAVQKTEENIEGLTQERTALSMELASLEGQLTALLEVADAAESLPVFAPPSLADRSASPNERLAAWDARVEYINGYLAELQTEKDDLLASIAGEQSIIDAALVQRGDAEAVLREAEWQQNPESLIVTPTVNGGVNVGDTDFTMDFRDMPEGATLMVGDDRYTIAAGNSFMGVGVPGSGTKTTFEVGIITPDGQIILLFDFDGIHEKAKWNGGGTGRARELPPLSHTRPIPEEDIVSPEQVSGAVAAIAATDTVIAEATGQKQEFEERLSEVIALMLAAGPELVAYPKMKVEADNSPLPSQAPLFRGYFQNKTDETVIEIRRAGSTGETLHFSHPGGTMDGEFRVQTIYQQWQHGPVTFLMSDGDGNLLVRTEGSYNNGRVGVDDGQLIAWDNFETGPIVENPIEPDIQIVHTAGPNVVFNAQFPYDEVTVILGGKQGMFSQTTLTHEGGTPFAAGMVTINAENAPGEYSLSFSHNGIALVDVTLDWNGTNLSVINDGDQLNLEEKIDNILILGEMTNAIDQMLLISQNALDGFANRQEYQREKLLRGSEFYVDNEIAYATGREYFDNKYPSLSSHPDAGGIFYQLYWEYQDVLGGLLQAAVDVAIAVRQGGSEQEARTEYSDAYAVAEVNRDLISLNIDFGISLPSKDEILKEGIQLAEGFTSSMLRAQEAVVIYWMREAKKADRREPKEMSDAAYQWNKDVIAIAHQGNPAQWAAVNNSFVTYAGRPEDAITAVAGNDGQESMVVDANGDEVIVGSTEVAMAIGEVLHSSGGGSFYYLGFTEEGMEKSDTEPVQLDENTTAILFFTLGDTRMVNFWTEGIDDRDITLSIKGGDLGDGYPSKKSGVTGESISLKLTPGTYAVSVKDVTGYETTSIASGSFEVSVHFEMQEYMSANIEGKISIPESTEVMSVSMKVAEFDESGERKEQTQVKELDSNKPVWVVVHGRVDNENSDHMKELAQSLTEHGVQVVTVDWSDSAKDNFPGLVGLQGSNWIEAVGAWSANQLKAIGFSPENINVVGHSWGSYVGYEIAEHIAGGVNTIVTLDPAKDTILSGYDESQANFAKYSNRSYAFHSSFYGEEDQALTADYAIRVVDENISRPSVEHGYAVTAFSSLLQSAQNPYDPVAAQFAPQKLMSSNPKIMALNGWDGTLHISTTHAERGDGSSWWKAIPQQLEYTDATTGNNVVDRSIGNHTIQQP